MLVYLLQVILFQLCFLLVYELLLKKETFFQANRWYLLLMPLVGFLLPLLELDGLRTLIPSQQLQLLPEVLLTTSENSVNSKHGSEAFSESINWWSLLYWLGFGVSLSLFIRKCYGLRSLYKGQQSYREKGSQIIIVPGSSVACTFLGTVFLGDQHSQKEKTQILNHELVHVREGHGLDLLWYELLKVVCWFNPMVYIFQNRLSELHEFIADSQAVSNAGKQEYFQQLLNTAFHTKDISFINQFFNHSLIKKRIVMLQKTKSKSLAKAKYLFLLPLLLGMLIVVSCSTDSQTEELPVSETQAVEVEERSSSDGPDGIPFSVVEDVPIFPGCEALSTNEERKQCMSEKVSEFVNSNFNTDVAKDLELTGDQRVYVQFRVTKSGDVAVNGARAPHPLLEEEAIRVVESLPSMVPASHQGEAVAIIYAIPIVFRAQ